MLKFLILIQAVSAFIRHSNHQNLIKAGSYFGLSFNKHIIQTSTSDDIKVERYELLRQSPELYNYVLSFSERGRKELTFALFVEHDFVSFLAGILKYDPHKKWNGINENVRAILCQSIEKDLNTKKDIQSIIDIIWCLGKLNADFYTLSPSFQTFILTIFSSIQPQDIGRDISRMLYGISLMNLKWYDLPKHTKDSIEILLMSNLPIMNPVEVVNTIYALGKMECIWDRLSPAFIQTILVNIQRSVLTAGRISISNLLWGMSKSKVKWDKLPQSLREDIYTRLRILSPLGHQTLSSSLTGLNKMQVTWQDLPLSVQEGIEMSLQSIVGAGEQAVANIILALGNMNVTKNDFELQTTHECILNAVTTVSHSFTAQGLSNTLLGLTKIGFTYNQFSSNLQEALTTACLDSKRKSNISHMKGQAVSNIIWSLGTMNAQWYTVQRADSADDDDNDGLLGSRETLERDSASHIHIDHNEDEDEDEDKDQLTMNSNDKSTSSQVLSKELCMGLLEAIEKTVTQMTEQGLSMTLLGLAKMNVEVKHLPLSLVNRLMEAIVRTSTSMGGQGICNCLWSLYSLGFIWSPTVLSNTMGSITPAVDPSFDTGRSTFQAATTPYQHIHILPNTVKEALYSAILSESRNMLPQSISLCLNSLAKLGCTYQEIPSTVLKALDAATERCLSTMSCREVSNTLYGLGKMNRYFTTLSPMYQKHLLIQILRTLPVMHEQEFGITIWSLLGQMNLNYYDLSPAIQHLICHEILQRQNSLTTQSLTAIFQGLSKMGNLYWYDISSQVQHSLLTSLEYLLTEGVILAGTSNSNNTSGSSGSSSSSSNSESSDKSDMMTYTQASRSNHNNEVNQLKLVGNVIYSLGRMSANWDNDIPEVLKMSIIRLLSSLCYLYIDPISIRSIGMNEKHIRHLSKSTAKRSKDDRCNTLEIPILHTYQLDPILNSINGLAKLSIHWEDIYEYQIYKPLLLSIPTLWVHTQSHITPQYQITATTTADSLYNQHNTNTSLFTHSSSMSLSSLANKFANMIWSLGQLNLQLVDIEEMDLSQLITTKAMMTSTTRISTLGKKKKNQYSSNEYDTNTIEIQLINKKLEHDDSHVLLVHYFYQCIELLFPYMSTYEFSWSLWSLAKMSITYTDLPKSVQTMLITHSSRFLQQANNQELGIILWAYGRMRAPLNDFPPDVTETILLGIDTIARRSNK